MKIKETIPPDILKEIKERMLQRLHFRNETYFFSYFEYQRKKLAISTVAVRVSQQFKKKKTPTIFIKKCVIRILGNEKKERVYVRDVDYAYIAGYRASYHSMRKHDTKTKRYIVNDYDDATWYGVDPRYFRLYYEHDFLNMSFLNNTEFRYCAYDWKSDLSHYLAAYRQNPKIELITKLLSSKFAASKVITSRVEKDRSFLIFLKNNAAEISASNANVNIVVNAYTSKKTIAEAIRLEKVKNMLTLGYGANEITREIYKTIKNMGEKTINEYFAYSTKVGNASYEDYFKCIHYLGLDLRDKKNLFPLDFKRWHDIRIDEYNTAKALKDAEERKEFYKKFAAVADKYASMSCDGKNGLCVIIAHSPYDLIREGELLHHCVGRMGYDQKFVREESLIFFVRETENRNTPFVTIEYGLKEKKVRQCHGQNNAQPPQKVLDFVYNVWEKQAAKILGNIKKAS